MFSLHSKKKKDKDYVRANGKLVFREIALFAGAHASTLKHILIIVPLVKLSIPYLMRFKEYGNPAPFQWDGILYSVCEFFPFGIYSWANLYFVLAGFLDF